MTDGGEQLPLWEIGVFGGGARLPHYRGSDEYSVYVLPLPYLIYRGEILRSDREGLRSIFFAAPRFESNLAMHGNPPVDDDNRARAGMPGIDAVGEIGPALQWFFLWDRDSLRRLYLQAAVRGAFSAGPEETGYQGLHGGLRLSFDDRSRWDSHRVRYGFSLSTDAADQDYNEYFYGVDEEYATADRPAYRARAGYGGLGISSFVAGRLTDSFSIAAYARWDTLEGAVFEDSPLVREKNNWVFGVALIWRIVKSDRTVTRGQELAP